MTNREQVAWCFSTDLYDAKNLAEIIADMLDAVKIYVTCGDVDRLAKWLELKCDPETNNWGKPPDEGGEDQEPVAETCAHCRWYVPFASICCSGDSEHRADIVNPEGSCPLWERGGNG